VNNLREELSSIYKTQAQNAQRLVHLTEQLHSTSERSSQQQAEILQLRAERNSREREKEEAIQLRKEKDRNIETLQDELDMIKLEFQMLEKRNEELKEDNSSLLRRWLEKKAQEAAEMDRMVADAQKKKSDASAKEQKADQEV
jgi:chromosome segregation ATPase